MQIETLCHSSVAPCIVGFEWWTLWYDLVLHLTFYHSYCCRPAFALYGQVFATIAIDRVGSAFQILAVFALVIKPLPAHGSKNIVGFVVALNSELR